MERCSKDQVKAWSLLFLNPPHNKEHLLLLEIIFVFFQYWGFILSNGDIFPMVRLDENYSLFLIFK